MGCISGCDARDDRTIGESSSIISGNIQQGDAPHPESDHEPVLIARGGRRCEENPFEAFAEELQRELAPRTLLERVLADRLVLSAWALHSSGAKEHAAIRSGKRSDECVDQESSRPRPRSRGRAEASPQDVSFVVHTLEKTVEVLRRLREEDQPRWGRPDPAGSKLTRKAVAIDTADAPEDSDLDGVGDDQSEYSNEWPFVSRGTRVEGRQDDAAPTESPELDRRWQDRLIFDVNVSEHSPVVKGTWVTVGHVVSLIVDGWTWTDILRTHPELNVDDIRTCLAYTVAEGNGDT
jgi:uncharacterized protein (DUF433 family)